MKHVPLINMLTVYASVEKYCSSLLLPLIMFKIKNHNPRDSTKIFITALKLAKIFIDPKKYLNTTNNNN